MSETSPSSHGPAPAYYPSSDAPAEKKGPGCFLWGCIIAAILVVGGTTAIVGSGYYMFVKLRDNFTETQPMALPQVSLSKEEREAVKDRFEAFRDAVDNGTAVDPFILTEDEINTLIAESDSDEPLKDSLRVQIEDDLLKGQISIPLDDIPLPGLKGRYFNGTADLRASLKDGKLEVYVENAEVKGEPLPKSVMDELRRENLTAETMKDPEARKTLEKIESIEVRDGQVIIVPKSIEDPGDAGTTEASQDAEAMALESEAPVGSTP